MGITTAQPLTTCRNTIRTFDYLLLILWILKIKERRNNSFKAKAQTSNSHSMKFLQRYTMIGSVHSSRWIKHPRVIMTTILPKKAHPTRNRPPSRGISPNLEVPQAQWNAKIVNLEITESQSYTSDHQYRKSLWLKFRTSLFRSKSIKIFPT